MYTANLRQFGPANEGVVERLREVERLRVARGCVWREAACGGGGGAGGWVQG